MTTGNENNLTADEYLDIHQFIKYNDPSYQKEFPSVYHHINSISDDPEKLSHIQLIINDSHHWQHDLALWCLIDNCNENITLLNISELRVELINICTTSNDYNTIYIIERLIFLQNFNNHFRYFRHLIELCIYLQIGHDAVNLLINLYENQSISFDDFINILKALWMKTFLVDIITNHGTEVLTKNFHHKNHFLQCNISIIQLFITSIAEPYESSELIKLFDYFTHEKNILSLEKLESFLCNNTGKTLDTCLNQLCILICNEHISKQIYILPKIRYNLIYCIERMLSKWSLDDICQLIVLTQNNEDIPHLNSILTIIVEFDLVLDRTIFDLTHRPIIISELSRNFHSYAVQVSLSKEMNLLQLNDLIDEIIEKTYMEMDMIEKTRKKEELLNQYKCLSVTFNRFSVMDVNALKNQLKSIRNFDFYSRISFIIRVSDVIFKTPMRSVQKLAILLALNSSDISARILQINTGEGKTRIISVLAVFKVFEGLKVDVITSSKELAIIQSKQLRGFYRFFQLKVGCNADLSTKNCIYGRMRKNRKVTSKLFMKMAILQPIYECDVIYGAADDFESHILQDEFDEVGLCCNRRCEFALVDEADNLMIDGHQHTLRLSNSVPSVFYLLPIKGAIWKLILELADIVKKDEGQWYKLIQDDNGSIVKELLDGSIMDFAEQALLPILKNVIHIEDIAPDRSTKKFIVPKHLHQITLAKLSFWIRNAAYARFEMKEGYDYILKNKKIICVNTTTGVLHDTMRLDNGLHFFLEMKHGCSIQSEQIITNFISHVTFFQRYSNNLIGLTGTIGGTASQRVFHEIYSANCIFIPPFRERRHYELRPYFAKNTEQWYNYITYSAEEKMKQNQAILIITKYIKEAQTIVEFLRVNFPDNVKLYSESEERHAVCETLQAGYVIVATNIAGRGTDILVSDEVEQNGGLHVCITFLPENDRVEQQNQGRTSRCGYRGTSQFIINTSEELDYEDEYSLDERERLKEMCHYRDITQEIMMDNAIEAIEETIKQDEIFQQFISLQKTIIQGFPSHVQTIAKDALREKFGRWLIGSSLKINPISQQSFEQFKNICQHDPKNTLIDNSVYYIHMANNLLKKRKYLDEAIYYLTKAIQMDPYCNAAAFYNRAYARMLQYKNTDDICRLKDAISDFEEAKYIIKEILDPSIEQFPVATTDSPLHEYLVHIKKLYNILLNSIDDAIGRSVDQQIKNFEETLKNTTLNDKQRKPLEENLNYLKTNRNQIENGVLQTVLKNKSEIKIERKTFMESLSSTEKKDLYEKEIEEFERNGFMGIIIFNERKPIQWGSVITLGSIGLGQIIAGMSLTVGSIGAGFGLGTALLQGGFSDLITCIRNGIINRDFSWIQWGLEKAVTLTVAIFSNGLSALRAVAKTVGCAATTIKNAINYGMKELWTKTIQEGIRIGGKKLVFEGAKRVTMEVGTKLVDSAVSATILPFIQTVIKAMIAEVIQLKFENHENLHVLVKCDGKQKNRFYANQLKNKILVQINEKTFMDLCLTIGATVIRIGSNSFSYKSIKIAGAIADKLVPIVKNVHNILNSMDKEINELVQSQEVQVILDQINHRSRLDGLTYMNSKIKQAENESITYTVKEFCSDIIDQISKMICQYLLGVTTSTLVSLGVNQVFSGLDKNVNEQLSLFQKRRTVLDHQILHKSDINDNVNHETLKIADVEIKNVELGTPAKIHHIGYISQAINRRFVIYNEQGCVEHVIGCNTSQPAIEIMFHPPNESNRTEYWTTVNGENVNQKTTYRCPFDIISEQSGLDILKIRQETVQAMSTNRSKLAAAIYDLKFLRQNHSDRLFFSKNSSLST